MAIDPANVVARDGVRGSIDDPTVLDDPRTMSVPIRLENGGEAWVPTHLLRREFNGTYTIDADMQTATRAARESSQDDTLSQSTIVETVPVLQEEVSFDKRKVDTAVVHIKKTVHEEEQLVDEPLFREEMKIDRVPVGQIVDAPEQIRQEGDTTIVPLLEEVLVVEKRLMVKEELHITRVRTERREPQRIPIRRELVSVEREEIRDQEEQIDV